MARPRFCHRWGNPITNVIHTRRGIWHSEFMMQCASRASFKSATAVACMRRYMGLNSYWLKIRALMALFSSELGPPHINIDGWALGGSSKKITPKTCTRSAYGVQRERGSPEISWDPIFGRAGSHLRTWDPIPENLRSHTWEPEILYLRTWDPVPEILWSHVAWDPMSNSTGLACQ